MNDVSFPYDPAPWEPGAEQPLYPAGNALSRRRIGGRLPAFRAVSGTPRSTPRRGRGTKGGEQPRPARERRARMRLGAARTRMPGLPTGARIGRRAAFDLLDEQHRLYLEELLPGIYGPGYTSTESAILRAGHHPLATGDMRVTPSTRHQGLARRAVILSYDATSNTAVVRDADAPDAPGYTVRVSPALTPAIMSSATEAGLALWDTGDPNDLLVSTVL